MRKEIELLGALHIAISILYTLISAAIFAVLISKGFFSSTANSSNMQYMVCAVVGVFLLLFAFCGIIAAMGVIREKSWSQMIILILGCLNLVCIPLGTALGVYTILIFMRSGQHFSGSKKSDELENVIIDTEQSSSLGMEARFPGKKAEI